MRAGTPKRGGSSKIGRGFLPLTDRHMTRMRNFFSLSTSVFFTVYVYNTANLIGVDPSMRIPLCTIL